VAKVESSRGFLSFLDGGDPAAERPLVRAFEQIFALILCVDYWTRVPVRWDGFGIDSAAVLALVSILSVATFSTAWRRRAFATLAIVQAIRLGTEFPGAGNHSYLELILCLLLAAFDTGLGEERRILLRAVRWMTCVVFFYAGLQKLVHGYYFHGELLTFSMATDTFRPVMQLLLPSAEFARLSRFTGKAGDGPYFTTSPLVLVLSNATWVGEMALAPLFALRRTRTAAVACAILFLFLVEAAAHEFVFGLLYVNMLLLFLDRDVNRRLIGLFAAFLGWMILVRMKILPDVVFH
jgi:hypothetical protein